MTANSRVIRHFPWRPNRFLQYLMEVYSIIAFFSRFLWKLTRIVFEIRLQDAEKSAIIDSLEKNSAKDVTNRESVGLSGKHRGENMAKIIAFANQKGGVGKTTTAVNLTAALSEMGKRVLLCDFDPQGNATSGVGVDPRNLETTVYDLILEDEPEVNEAIVKTKWADVLGSNTELAGAEIDLISMPEREYRLQKILNKVSGQYDYIMIDCPPSLGILTLNCLCAADAFLVPLQCEYYALEGLSQLMNTVRAVQRGLNKEIKLEGVLLTMFDGRTNLSIQVVEEVKKHFGDKVYSTVVPRNVRLSEAPSHGQPITAYDRYCRGAEAYQELAQEFIAKN